MNDIILFKKKNRFIVTCNVVGRLHPVLTYVVAAVKRRFLTSPPSIMGKSPYRKLHRIKN